MYRRRALLGIASMVTVGCLGSENDADGDTDDDDGDGPEAARETLAAYEAAFANADRGRLHELIHPESSMSVPPGVDLEELIFTVEETTVLEEGEASVVLEITYESGPAEDPVVRTAAYEFRPANGTWLLYGSRY